VNQLRWSVGCFVGGACGGLRDRGKARAGILLVLVVRIEAERLAEILLVVPSTGRPQRPSGMRVRSNWLSQMASASAMPSPVGLLQCRANAEELEQAQDAP
jgi:hypothetical protein